MHLRHTNNPPFLQQAAIRDSQLSVSTCLILSSEQGSSLSATRQRNAGETSKPLFSTPLREQAQHTPEWLHCLQMQRLPLFLPPPMRQSSWRKASAFHQARFVVGTPRTQRDTARRGLCTQARSGTTDACLARWGSMQTTRMGVVAALS